MSKIKIKKENKGKFKAAAKKAGMGVQEYATSILSNKGKYSPSLVRQATFAVNANKWNSGDRRKKYGGWIANMSDSDTLDMFYTLNEEMDVKKFGGFLKDMGRVALDMNPVGLASTVLTGKSLSSHVGAGEYETGVGKVMKTVGGIQQAVVPQLLNAAVPGAGTALNSITEQTKPMFDDQSIEQSAASKYGLMNNIPTMQYGGELPLTKYSGLKHSAGGIDIGVAEVEDNEVVWEDKGLKYIFSDTLNG